MVKALTRQNQQVVYLYVASLLGLLLGLLSSIVNTRFVSPSDYGDVRYVQNIIQFLASLLLFGYFLSGSRLLALSKSEKESKEIRGGMILILCASTIVLFILLYLCSLFFGDSPKISHLFLLSIPVCGFPLFNNYINTTAQGDNHIGRLALSRLLPYLIYIPTAYYIFSSYGASSESLILLQWGIYTFTLLIIIISTKPRFSNLKRTFSSLNKENKSYGLQLYYGSLAMLATNYIAGISLGYFNEDNINVGFYTLALTVVSPLSMLPSIIGTTYFKEFATMNKIPSKVLKATIVITILTCILYIALIQPLVNLLYSEAYSKVGLYASIMSVGFSIHGVGDMLNRYLGSHGQGRCIRNSSYACGIFKIIGFTLFVYLWDINGALITNILSSSAYFFVLLFYYYRFVRAKVKA